MRLAFVHDTPPIGGESMAASKMKIDVNQNRDIAYWAEKFGVTKTQLIAAVAAAGPDVADVERKLRQRRTPRPATAKREARRRLAFHSFD